jgi:hypothetical protein
LPLVSGNHLPRCPRCLAPIRTRYVPVGNIIPNGRGRLKDSS